MFARATPVFAAEQVDGYQAPVVDAPDPADHFADRAGRGFRCGNGRDYQPRRCPRLLSPFNRQHPELPTRDAFTGTPTSAPAEGYYSTLLHELTHWTSPEARCNRQFGKRFGDQAYAIEELAAELGAAFLCADLGITDEPRPDHAQYLATWLAVLKADKKAIFAAASKASQAAEFLSGFRGSDPLPCPVRCEMKRPQPVR